MSGNLRLLGKASFGCYAMKRKGKGRSQSEAKVSFRLQGGVLVAQVRTKSFPGAYYSQDTLYVYLQTESCLCTSSRNPLMVIREAQVLTQRHV